VKPYVSDPDFTLYAGEALEVLRDLPDAIADCVVTSPPYLDARDDVPAFADWPSLFFELQRVCTGPMLFNVGRRWVDGAEWLWWLKVVEAAAYSGVRLLDTLVWIKPNANPIHGRVFANRHEYVLILGRRDARLNADAVRVPYAESSVPRLRRGWLNHTGVKNDVGRKRGRRQSEPHPLGGRGPSYVVAHTGGEKGNPHPTPMPLALAEHLVSLASWPGQTVLDPFFGSGTTGLAARRLERKTLGIEISADHCALAARRSQQQPLLLAEDVA
jgi:site-specific DNA-methyltransferase (adenine-specific)